MSAFFLYSQAFRQRTKEENPEAGFGDLVSEFGLLQGLFVNLVDCRVFCGNLKCWSTMAYVRDTVVLPVCPR